MDYPSPPDELNEYIGGGPFQKIGQRWFRQFVELGNLQPDDNVLDVGCGAGRMAFPLIQFLKNGNYEGFDLSIDGIKWCIENIESKYPNFHFKHVDVSNDEYNINGKIKSSEFEFPYKSESFDFVFLTSVFTHMRPLEMENYLSEISRVLKNNKNCVISYFLLNPISLKNIEAKSSEIDFVYEFEGFRSNNRSNPERAIAYDESVIRTLCDKSDLKIIEPIHYGKWSGRKEFLMYQDFVVAQKGKNSH